jgi:hypothetical protein
MERDFGVAFQGWNKNKPFALAVLFRDHGDKVTLM